MNKKILCGALILGVSSVVSGADFSPFQRSHEGMWYDPNRPGEFFQVYPYTQGGEDKAIITYQILGDDTRDWSLFGVDNFSGSSVEVEEDALIERGNGEVWKFAVDDAQCNKITVSGPEGDFSLERIAPPAPDQTCPVVCRDPDFGPFNPACVR